MKNLLVLSWPLILREINKCIMVCSNHHSEIHAGMIDTSGFKVGIQADVPDLEEILEQVEIDEKKDPFEWMK